MTFICVYTVFFFFVFVCTKRPNKNATSFGNKLSNKLCEFYSNFLGLAKFLRLEEMVDWLKLLKFRWTYSNWQGAIRMNTKIGGSTIFKAETE